MKKIALGINTGFAVNRFPEPEVWVKIAGQTLGLRHVQFTADLLNPFLPKKIVESETNKIIKNLRKYDVSIDCTFTGSFTRVNHLMHPDAKMREVWFEWFKKFLLLSKNLGAKSAGSHFGILSDTDVKNKSRYNSLVKGAIDYWQELALYGKKIGLDFLNFEPMSIPREMAYTIKETKALLERTNEGIAIPMLLCLDVDHGFASSKDPRDNDPYAWLDEFAGVSPIIHIKQSLFDKGGHYPFTKEYNAKGRIIPEKVVDIIIKKGCEETLLILEISHRERYPQDLKVADDLLESVKFWRTAVKD